MSNTIVAHPETGQPVREVKSYVELDRAQLEQEVTQNQTDLDQLIAAKTAEFQATLENDADVQAARSAVEDSKSELEAYDQLAPVASDAAGEEGTSSENETDGEAGDGSDGTDEPAADPGVDNEPEVAEEATEEEESSEETSEDY